MYCQKWRSDGRRWRYGKFEEKKSQTVGIKGPVTPTRDHACALTVT